MANIAIIGHCPVVIVKIFEHLPARDLCNYSRVCKLWNSIVQAELLRRRGIVHFHHVLTCTTHGVIDNCRKCCVKKAQEFEEEFREQLHNLEIRPAFCIAFISSSFWEHYETLFPRSSKPANKKFRKMYDDDSRQKHLESVIKRTFMKHLPSKCKVCCYVGNRLIIGVEGSRVFDLVEGPAICGYLFSALPGNPLKICKRNKYGGDVIKTMLTSADIKAALSLVEHKGFRYFCIAIEEIKRRFNAIEKAIIFPTQAGSFNIPIFMGPNVEAEVCNFREKVPSREILRNDHQKRQVAFVFQYNNFTDPDLMAIDIVRRSYPNIPIIGFDGFPNVEGDLFEAMSFDNEVRFLLRNLQLLLLNFTVEDK